MLCVCAVKTVSLGLDATINLQELSNSAFLRTIL